MPFIGSLDSFVKMLVTVAFAMTLMQYFINVPYIIGAVLPIALLAVAGGGVPDLLCRWMS